MLLLSSFVVFSSHNCEKGQRQRSPSVVFVLARVTRYLSVFCAYCVNLVGIQNSCLLLNNVRIFDAHELSAVFAVFFRSSLSSRFVVYSRKVLLNIISATEGGGGCVTPFERLSANYNNYRYRLRLIVSLHQ